MKKLIGLPFLLLAYLIAPEAHAQGGFSAYLSASCNTAITGTGPQPLFINSTGNLCTAGTGGGGGSNAAAGTNGVTAPTSSSSTGYTNSGGNETAVSPSTPLPVVDSAGDASLSTIATNSGTQATAANQTSGNASLSTIATNSGTQATAANQTTGNTSAASTATNTAATNTALPLTWQDQTITGAAAQSTAGNNILLATAGTGFIDTKGYRSICVQVNGGTGITAGNITFEQSADSTNVTSFTVQDTAVQSSNPLTTYGLAASVNRSFCAPVQQEFIRFRISTAIAGGTAQAYTRLSQTPYSPFFTTVSNNNSSTNQVYVGNLAQGASGATNTGNPEKAGFVYNATLPTVTTGQIVDGQANANGQPYAVTVIQGVTTTRTNGTITTANTFQSVLASSATRKGCRITNTSTNAMTLDTSASPLAATAIPLAAGATFTCDVQPGYVITDQINLTSATAASTYVVWNQ